GDVEQGGGAGRGVEYVGEGVPYGRGGAGREQAVAVQRRRIGADWAAAPQLPVEQAELGVQQVRPVQITVHGFPLPHLDRQDRKVLDRFSDRGFVLAYPRRGGRSEHVEAAAQLGPPL